MKSMSACFQKRNLALRATSAAARTFFSAWRTKWGLFTHTHSQPNPPYLSLVKKNERSMMWTDTEEEAALDPKSIGDRGRIGKDMKSRRKRRIHADQGSTPRCTRQTWFQHECEDALWEMEEDRLNLYHRFAYENERTSRGSTSMSTSSSNNESHAARVERIRQSNNNNKGVVCISCKQTLAVTSFTPSQLRRRAGREGSTCTPCVEAQRHEAKDRAYAKRQAVKKEKAYREEMIRTRLARRKAEALMKARELLFKSIEKRTDATTPQSLRGRSSNLQESSTTCASPHARMCLDVMLERERALCGPFCVFYHSYSFSALLYELHAVWAELYMGYNSETAPVPRIQSSAFKRFPDAESLVFHLDSSRTLSDHDAHFRSAGIAAATNLFEDPEMRSVLCFELGYSCLDVDYSGLLTRLLIEAFHIPNNKLEEARNLVIDVARKHKLPVSTYIQAPPYTDRVGHMLQIFIATSLVDKYAFPCLPFGRYDSSRENLSKHLSSNAAISGQVRICAHPLLFTDPRTDTIQVFHYSGRSNYCRKSCLADLREAIKTFMPKA